MWDAMVPDVVKPVVVGTLLIVILSMAVALAHLDIKESFVKRNVIPGFTALAVTTHVFVEMVLLAARKMARVIVLSASLGSRVTHSVHVTPTD